MRTWVDSSTLIALDLIGEALVLRDLLGGITITAQVRDEVFVGKESQTLSDALGTWINVLAVRGRLERWTALGLGVGEASLFLTPTEDRLVVDEVPARKVAQSEGRDYVGLLGLILAGVDAGKLSSSRAKAVLRDLSRSSFRLSTDLYDEALRQLDRPR